LSEELSLWALFISAFVSSTILPGGSEVLLGVLLIQQSHDPVHLLIVATLGNTFGGVTSWTLGWLIAKRYSAQSTLKPQHQAALLKLRKWGVFALLFSWLPLIGDPLCVAAGWLRMNFWLCISLIAIGKFLRYFFVFLVFA